MIDLRVDQHDPCDGAVAPGAAWLKTRIGKNLCPDVGGRIDQRKAVAVPTDCDRRLCSGGKSRRAGAHAQALRAVAIPLWKAAARGRTQDLNSESHWLSKKTSPGNSPGLSVLQGRHSGHRKT